MKLSGDFTCSKCGVRLYHHGLTLDEDTLLELTCWTDSGGCGYTFIVKPVISKWLYLDDLGSPTGEEPNV